jgi:alcohol dehydrogenase class IV
MPDDLNAATGLDALTHGIEAFVSLAHGPLTDHHALQAISLVHANLVPHDDAPARPRAPQRDGAGRRWRPGWPSPTRSSGRRTR